MTKCEAVHPEYGQCEQDGPHDIHAVFVGLSWTLWPNDDYVPIPVPARKVKRGSKLAMAMAKLYEPKVQVQKGAQDTSLIAAGIELPVSAQHRNAIYGLLISTKGGCTDDEIAMWLNMSLNTVRPRRGELVDGGLVQDSGVKRPSAMGNPAIVWEAIPVFPSKIA